MTCKFNVCNCLIIQLDINHFLTVRVPLWKASLFSIFCPAPRLFTIQVTHKKVPQMTLLSIFYLLQVTRCTIFHFLFWFLSVFLPSNTNVPAVVATSSLSPHESPHTISYGNSGLKHCGSHGLCFKRALLEIRLVGASPLKIVFSFNDCKKTSFASGVIFNFYFFIGITTAPLQQANEVAGR